MSGLVLSLFPGIGLLDMAFEEEGFCVVRGPDLLWGGDIRRFHPPAGRFDGVIGGPPCQLFSTMKRRVPQAGERHGNMIPEFERCVTAARSAWFLMENVPAAPLPIVAGYFVEDQLVRDDHLGGETTRTRRFSFGSRTRIGFWIETLALHRPDPEPAALAAGGRRERARVTCSGERRRYTEGYKTEVDFKNHLRLQGLSADFLADAPFTMAAKVKAVGNGVPLAMGRAVAAAVKRALSEAERSAA